MLLGHSTRGCLQDTCVTNAVSNQAGQKQSRSSQGWELTPKQRAVGSGCFLGMQGGVMLPGFLPSWVPGVGRRKGRPREEQLDTGVMVNFSMRPKVKMTPISVCSLSKCMEVHTKRKFERFSRNHLKPVHCCLLQNSFRPFPG